MKNIALVIHREYMTRVRKRSFVFLTLLTPLLFVALIAVTLHLSKIPAGEARYIVVADATGEYFPVFENTDQYRFVEAEGGFLDFRQHSDETIYATVVITDDLLRSPDAVTLYSPKQVAGSAVATITTQLNDYLSEKKLASYNIPNIRAIIDESKVAVQMQTIRWDENSGQETETSAEAASLIGMLFTFLIYAFIFGYGAMVMQGVIEEKSNRIIEVMISSVKPFDLMMGKLIGIGLVGLTQFGIWGLLIGSCALIGLATPEHMAQLGNAGLALGSTNLIELCFYFVLFFIGGYLMYASLFAAIGAMVDNQEDTQQYVMPLTIVILFAFYAGFYSVQNPDGPLAFWASIIPFTSPIVMMTRLSYGVPWWELVLSITLLVVTVILVVALAAKIYRVGILMYGKKISFREIARWVRY